MHLRLKGTQLFKLAATLHVPPPTEQLRLTQRPMASHDHCKLTMSCKLNVFV